MDIALPLRVAPAGAGMISRQHLLAWQKLEPHVQVVAICDPDRSRGESRAKEFKIEDIYDTAGSLFSGAEFDALDVVSPREPRCLPEHPRAVPKTTPTLGEAESLLRDLPTGARLMVHENWRFRPWYRLARQWIDEGLLGALQLCRMSLVSSGMLPDDSGRSPAFVRQPFVAGEHRLMIAEVLIHLIRYRGPNYPAARSLRLQAPALQ